MTQEQHPQPATWTPSPQTHPRAMVGHVVMALEGQKVVPSGIIGRVVDVASFGSEVLYMVDWWSATPPEYPIVRRVMRRTEFRVVEEG